MKYLRWNAGKKIFAFLLALSLFFSGWGNYDLTVVRAEGTVEVSLESTSATFSGADLSLPAVTSVKLDSVEIVDDTTRWSVKWTDSLGAEITTGTVRDAGTYTCTVTVSGIDKDVMFVVNPYDASGLTIVLSKTEAYYTGEEIAAPEVTVSIGSNTLTVGEDYTASWDSTPFQDKKTYNLLLSDGSKNNLTNLSGIPATFFEIKEDDRIDVGNITVSGSVFNGTDTYYYKDASDVTLTPDDSCTIQSVTSGGTLVDGVVTLTDGASSVQLVLKSTAPGGGLREISVGTFVNDTTGPTGSGISIDYTNHYTDAGSVDWAQSISGVTVNAADAGVGYRGVELDSVIYDTIEALAGKLVELGTGTYSYKLVDQLDNKSADMSVTVRKLDSIAPVITVKDGESNVDISSPMYLKQSDLDGTNKKVYGVIADDGDGVGVDESTLSSIEFFPTDVSAVEAKQITKTVKDYCQNEATATLNIVYDPIAPVVYEPVLATSGVKDEVHKAAGNSILAGDDVTVTVKVTDDYFEKVELVNSEGTVVDTVSAKSSDDTYGFTIAKQAYLCDQYKIRATDKSGNVSESALFTVEIDTTAPVLKSSDITLSTKAYADAHLGWTNTDTEFALSIDTSSWSDKDSGANKDLKIQYKKETDSTWNVLTGSKSGDVWSFSFTEPDATFNGNYQFKACDPLGHESSVISVALKKDKVKPDTDNIKVQYISDTGTDTGKKGFLGAIYRLFAKTTIEVDLYVRDEISGVDSVTVKFLDASVAAQPDEGHTAVIDGINYQIFHCRLTLPGFHSEDGQLQITQIEDVAGNIVPVSGVIPQLVAEGTDILIIDNVAPAISIDYGSAVYTDSDKKYYKKTGSNTSETFKLKVVEKYLESQEDASGQIIYPTVTLKNLTDGGSESDITSGLTWSRTTGSDEYVAEVVLPYGISETEYQILVQYADGSGNRMTWNGASDGFCTVDATGKMTSGIFVLDPKEPVLKAYAVAETANGSSVVEENIIPVYKNLSGAEDITFRFEIEDHYWNVDRFKLEVRNTRANTYVTTEDASGVTWTSSGDLHIGEYKFDGEELPASYQLKLSYHDEVGYKMLQDSSVTVGSMADGVYAAPQFILDHVAPKFSIAYNQAYRLIKNDDTSKSADIMNAEPQAGYAAYFNNIIEVIVTIQEDYARKILEEATIKGLNRLAITLSKTGETATSSDITQNFTWEKTENGYQGKYEILEEGDYQITVSYEDEAANQMVAGDHVAGGTLATGLYTSELLILDKTAPVIWAELGETVINTYHERFYYKENTVLKLKVEDKHTRAQELKSILMNIHATKAANSDGSVEVVTPDDASKFVNAIAGNTVSPGITWDIPLGTEVEANYDIPMSTSDGVVYEDLAGNKATKYQLEGEASPRSLSVPIKVCVDKKKPMVTMYYELRDATFIEKIKYLLNGYWFANGSVDVRIDAEDEIAGIQKIVLDVNDGTATTTYPTAAVDFGAWAKTDYTLTLPISTADFKGTLQATVTDWCNFNSTEISGGIIESQSKHDETGSVEIITNTNASRYTNGKVFYNKDVDFTVTFKDDYSGLNNYTLTGGSTINEQKDYKAENATTASEITNSAVLMRTLSASSNNKNDVPVTATFTDNTNHTSTVTQKYNIDITDPVIEVTYDLNSPSNVHLYNRTRTATVTITERNFDKDDVIFHVTNTEGGMPTFGSWSSSGSGDETKNVCTVTFSENGDYTFTLEFQDMAGNEANYSRVDRFVIDKVAPVISMDYGSVDVSSDKKYYRKDSNESETIQLKVVEKYLERQLDISGQIIYPTVTLKNLTDGSESDITSGLTWSRTTGSDEYVAEVVLPYGISETEYQILVQYADGSGNRMTWNGASDGFCTVDETGKMTSGIFVLDPKEPVLKAYAVAETASGSSVVNGSTVPVYENVEDAEDITFHFTVEDHYWDASRFGIKILNTKTNACVAASGITWTSSGDLHSGEYKFDGESLPASYQLELSYKDEVGYEMLQDASVTIGTMAAGVYTAPQFILDHTAPKFSIAYNKSYRLVKNTNTAKSEDIMAPDDTEPQAGYTAYYNDKIDVTITIEEDYALENIVESDIKGLNHLEIKVNNTANGTISDISQNLVWEKNENTYQSVYHITDEGDYQITVIYKDEADNQMVAGAHVAGGTLATGLYTSELLILDKTAPVIQAELNGTRINTYNERFYYNADTVFNLEVVDKHTRFQEMKSIISEIHTTKAAKNDGSAVVVIPDSTAYSFINGIEGSTVTAGFTWNIPMETEANYDIPLAASDRTVFEDLAGNKATAYQLVGETSPRALSVPIKACVDKNTSVPTVGISYAVREATFKEKIEYLLHGYWFANGSVDVLIDAEDEIAGVQKIVLDVNDGTATTTYPAAAVDFGAWAKTDYTLTLPISTADFKGTLHATVSDWCNFAVEETKGGIIESQSKHDATGSVKITTNTEVSRRTQGKDFYNKDVNFTVTFKDDYSGLNNYKLTGGSTISEQKDYKAENTVTQAPITNEAVLTRTLSASSNNKNDVPVTATFTDNTNHTSTVTQNYNIDITAPTIEVVYDLNSPSNGHFYNHTRTATVTITERNFDQDDVVFRVTNTDGTMPTFGSWSSSGSGDETKNVCTVTFSADGDYTFTLEFQDMAGNKADYSKIDEFTIDQTIPTVTVTYDNQQSMNDSYYAQNRTATIDILEHNFDPALIHVQTTANGAVGPAVSGWSRNGDHNVATVAFHSDADFTFDIEGVDQADNPLADYEMDSFTVDTTAPELEIYDIDNMSANNDVVAPGIRFSDTNYDADGTVIMLKGYHNGEQQINGNRRVTGEGVEIKMADFERVASMDDLYTMEATVYDLAGNSSEASVTFSVNRFGSVYTFDEATDQLIGDNGSYYTNEEQALTITETNVDTLEFKEITCNLNGDLKTLKEGTDYSVNVSGDEMSWKQYTYHIGKENFAEEGTYILTIYSEDRAGNTSNNNSKGKKMEFVVDKTNPSILISGVENNGQYREDSREITLDVQDNVRLSKVEVTLNGTMKVYDAAEVAEQDGKLRLVADSSNHWQTLKVSAYDAAGNEQSSEEMRFLVTANVLVQFYMNTPVFVGTMTGGSAAAFGIWWAIFKKKLLFR